MPELSVREFFYGVDRKAEGYVVVQEPVVSFGVSVDKKVAHNIREHVKSTALENGEVAKVLRARVMELHELIICPKLLEVHGEHVAAYEQVVP